MSSASAPSLAPKSPSASNSRTPSVVPPQRKPYWILIAIVVLGAIAYWAVQANRKQAETGKTAVAAIRTATIYKGNLYQTIRLTGTTAAKDFAMLVTPSLRGSRGDGHRDATLPTSGVAMDLTVKSNNTGGSASSSNASTASTSSGSTDSTGSNAGPASTAGTGSSLSTALQSSTSRVGQIGSAPTSSNLVTGNTSGSVTNTSLGSTAGSLVSTGGGGGGGDFGLVLQHLASPGTKLKKGDTAAEFDRQNMLLRLDDYRAAVLQTESAVNKMKTELAVGMKMHEQQVATAKADLDKAKLDLKATPVLGVMDTERLKLALEEAEAKYKELIAETKFVEIGQQAQLRNAEMDLAQSRIELKRAESNAERMLVKAPISGLAVVQQTFRGSEFAQIKEGDQLWPGQSFMQVVDTTGLIVNATVNQVDIEKLRIGQQAKIHFDAYPGLELMGHLYAIGAITKAGGMRASFVKEVPVQIRLDQMDPRVIPDLSVSADVILGSEEQATIAPLSAIFAEAGAAPVVYVKTEEGWEKRAVQLGLANRTAVSVRSGLKPGESVATITPPRPSEKGKS